MAGTGIGDIVSVRREETNPMIDRYRQVGPGHRRRSGFLQGYRKREGSVGVIMPAARVVPTTYTEFLPHTSISVRQARAQLASELYARDVLSSVVDDAVLILSEFVTNSLRHARALSSGTIRVFWSLSSDGLLRIEVTDGGGTTWPSTKPYSTSVSAYAGRGLEIVDRLADRWGSQREEGDDEYTVWAELAVRARHADRRFREQRNGSPRPGLASVRSQGGAANAEAHQAAQNDHEPSGVGAAQAGTGTGPVLHLLPPYPTAGH
jgi:anti-sigma regulatory factor (Ser/Thr protein kinase)